MSCARPVEVESALARLARVLGVAPGEVDFLAPVGVGGLRALRDQVADRLAADGARRFATVVSASALVPPGIAAAIAERWFGPVLCAQLVGLVTPRQGARFARHLSIGFMADITARTDPRAVGRLAHELPLRTMRSIATTLLERGDHLSLACFVDHLPPGIVADILETIDDDAAVVRIARHVEDPTALDPIVALVPDERLLALVEAVADEDLWRDGLHLFGHLGPTQVARVAATIVERDQAAVVAAIEGFSRHDLWSEALGMLTHLGPDELARVADALAGADDELLAAAVTAADAHDRWAPLVHVAAAVTDDDAMTDQLARRLADLVARLPRHAVERFERTADALGHRGVLDTLLRRAQ